MKLRPGLRLEKEWTSVKYMVNNDYSKNEVFKKNISYSEDRTTKKPMIKHQEGCDLILANERHKVKICFAIQNKRLMTFIEHKGDIICTILIV